MKPVPHGEPYAGKLHVRFDEGAGVPDNKGRPALLYTLLPTQFLREKSREMRPSRRLIGKRQPQARHRTGLLLRG